MTENGELVLDLFCGQGGAAQGYINRGFRVLGVDNVDHSKRYPGEFVKADALEFLAEHGSKFRIKHASPPCQGYSIATAGNLSARHSYKRLIAATRDLFDSFDGLWVIENVELAKYQMHNPMLLCGRMFNLTALDEDGVKLVLDRHRLFETNFDMSVPDHPVHGDEQVAGVYGGSRRAKRLNNESLAEMAPLDRYAARVERGGGYVPRSRRVLEELLGGVSWMTLRGMQECIPPVYTEYVAEQIQAHGH